jgi:hypothetical protein
MGIMLRMRTLPAGFIAPCLPTKTDKLPSGGLWVHEIKHDGFRVVLAAPSLTPSRNPQIRIISPAIERTVLTS